MPFAGCTADVLHDPLRRRFRMHGFLSHLHSLMVTMSQKSFVPQAVKSVSQALMSDSMRVSHQKLREKPGERSRHVHIPALPNRRPGHRPATMCCAKAYCDVGSDDAPT